MGYFFSSATPAASNPDILFWPCNDGSGTTITATVGAGSTNFDGTWSDLTGGNYALALNGSQKADSASVTYGTSNITLKFKIKPASWSGGATAIELIQSAGTYRFRIYNAYNLLYFQMFSGASVRYAYISTSLLATGSWHDVSVNLNAVATNGSFTIYTDGVLRTPTLDGSGNLGGNTYTAGVLTVGAASNGFSGEFDALEIWAGNQTP